MAKVTLYSPLRLVLVIFFLLYCAISLVNHYCFRTYALDLGVYTSALYDYAHFGFNDARAFKPYAENLLADHFDLYLPLLSPLSWVLGVYTLLLAQMAAVLYGGVGIYRLFELYGRQTAIMATVYFLSFFGILSAVSYDYHSNVIAAGLLPWLALSIRRQLLRSFIIYFVLILIAKENLALLLLVFLPCMLWVEKPLAPGFKKAIWMAAAFSLVYFIVITTVVMPGLSHAGKLSQFRYALLGEGYGEAIQNVATHPVQYAGYLFQNHLGDPKFDYIKAELWIFMLLCGGVLLLFNWPFIAMLLPVLAQKLYHNQPGMWGINDHYSADLAVILTIGVFYTLNRNKLFIRPRKILQYVFLFLSLGLSIRMMDHPTGLVRRDNLRVYKSLHYTPVLDRTAFAKAAALVPENAAVSCQSLLQPHFAWRDSIYLFPDTRDAKYILLYTGDDYYPLTKAQYAYKVDSLKQVPGMQTVFDEKGIVLLERK